MTFTGKNTSLGKTASVIQSADGTQSHLQRMLISIMAVQLLLCLVFTAIAFVYLLLSGGE